MGLRLIVIQSKTEDDGMSHHVTAFFSLSDIRKAT